MGLGEGGWGGEARKWVIHKGFQKRGREGRDWGGSNGQNSPLSEKVKKRGKRK